MANLAFHATFGGQDLLWRLQVKVQMRKIMLGTILRYESRHYAFHVADPEFDATFHRVQRARLTYGRAPWNPDDAKLNDWGGDRSVCLRTGDGHLLELMTVPQ
jgi:catechol 2,3-dioxygenase-like lactoylglutathione lyase family enzyme